jgi:hypothetical protein
MTNVVKGAILRHNKLAAAYTVRRVTSRPRSCAVTTTLPALVPPPASEARVAEVEAEVEEEEEEEEAVSLYANQANTAAATPAACGKICEPREKMNRIAGSVAAGFGVEEGSVRAEEESRGERMAERERMPPDVRSARDGARRRASVSVRVVLVSEVVDMISFGWVMVRFRGEVRGMGPCRDAFG